MPVFIEFLKTSGLGFDQWGKDCPLHTPVERAEKKRDVWDAGCSRCSPVTGRYAHYQRHPGRDGIQSGIAGNERVASEDFGGGGAVKAMDEATSGDG